MKDVEIQFNNINKILIQRLRKYNFQNFSQLLNVPEPEPTYFSYFESIANLIYDSVYDNKSNIQSEIKNDLSKFLEDAITIEDSSKKVKNKKSNNQIDKIIRTTNYRKKLKFLIYDKIDTYINKISVKYNLFCTNHYEIKKTSNNNKIYNNKINNKDNKIIKSKSFLNLQSTYISNKDILINIPEEYQVPNEKFKTNTDLLIRTVDDMKKKSKELIAKSTLIDKELEIILGHTNKLDNYIQQNWLPWNNYINLYFESIKNYHIKIDSIKKKCLENTSKLILKEIKRKNIKKFRIIFIQFRKMKESISTLKVLITDIKKYKLTNELISKNKINLDKLKKVLNKKVSLLDLFELSFNNFKAKNSTHMSGELSQILNEYFNGFAYLDESNENKNNYKFYNISENYYNILISYSYGIKHLLENLKFKENKDEIVKINNVCEYLIQNNLINSIYIKLRGIFTNIANDVLNQMIEFFKAEIERKEEIIEINENKNKEDLANKNNNDNNNEEVYDKNIKSELCLLICLIISKLKFNKNVKDFINVIIKNIKESNDENLTKTIKGNFETECNEIIKIMENSLHIIIKNQISKCFNDSIMNSRDEYFLKHYYLINDIIAQVTITDDKLKNILLQYQYNYIKNWTKCKIKKFYSSEYKSWEPFTEIPKEYQLLLNFYFEFNINKNALGVNNDDFLKIFENFEKIKNDFTKTDNNVEKIEFLSFKFKNNKKDIETINIKINKTALDIINTSVNFIKLFCLISPSSYGILLESFSEILIRHLTYQKEEIFSYKNSSTVTQKEVCMAYTIFILIKYIYQYFKDCDFFVLIMKNSEQKAINTFLSVFKIINECLDLSKKKIEEILNINCIDEALKQLDEIELPNYNIPEKGSEIPVNGYVYTFISSMKIIYDSMLNCFEADFMVKIFQAAIVKFFDKFEYFIFHGQLIEEEKCLKQFKKDMTFLKRNMNFINIFDLNEIKSRINKINKKVLPDYMIKTKKKGEEK